MVKIELSLKHALEYIILGIENERYQAAINLAQDLIDKLNAQTKTNQALDPDGKK